MPLRLALLVVVVLLARAASASGAGTAGETASLSPLDRWSPFIAEASRRFGVPDSWIRAVIRAESGGQSLLDGQPITSGAGAMGLMQLMPRTWTELRGLLGLGLDAYDPHDNILAGTSYLRALYERYGYPGLFAAYNAGPARFDDHLFGGRPLPAETLAYLATFEEAAVEPVRTPAALSGTNLFFSLRTAADRPPDSWLAVSSGALFVPLSGLRGPDRAR